MKFFENYLYTGIDKYILKETGEADRDVELVFNPDSVVQTGNIGDADEWNRMETHQTFELGAVHTIESTTDIYTVSETFFSLMNAFDMFCSLRISNTNQYDNPVLRIAFADSTKDYVIKQIDRTSNGVFGVLAGELKNTRILGFTNGVNNSMVVQSNVNPILRRSVINCASSVLSAISPTIRKYTLYDDVGLLDLTQDEIDKGVLIKFNADFANSLADDGTKVSINLKGVNSEYFITKDDITATGERNIKTGEINKGTVAGILDNDGFHLLSSEQVNTDLYFGASSTPVLSEPFTNFEEVIIECATLTQRYQAKFKTDTIVIDTYSYVENTIGIDFVDTENLDITFANLQFVRVIGVKRK